MYSNNLHIFLLFITITTAWTIAGCAQFPTECGNLDPIEGDIRTFAPWTAAIFIREENSPPKYFTTGTIIGPNTILASARGPFGSIFRGGGKDGLLPPPNIFVIGAGLNSTDYDATDEHAQFSEVNYLEPHLTNDATNEHYHFMLYHLKTLLDFRTPYVKAICLLEDLSGSSPPSSGLQLISTGFSVPDLKTQVATLNIATIKVFANKPCSSYFRFHYKREPFESNAYCGVKSNAAKKGLTKSLEFLKSAVGLSNPVITSNGSCFLHGGVAAFDVNKKWYLSAVLTMIPDRKKGVCGDSSVYIYGRISQQLSWMASSISCSPNKFACEDSSNKCIPITSVCNGASDCPDGKDEHEIFCKAQDFCAAYSSGAQRSCGVNGNCILKSQICDGKFDCAEGNDELNCDNGDDNVLSLMFRSAARDCPQLKLPRGTQATCSQSPDDCLSQTAPNTVITFACKEHHISPYAYSNVELTCDAKKGTWKNNLPFSCLQECGISIPLKTILKTPAFKNWGWSGKILTYASIKENKSSQLPSCSAVFIEPAFALTSAKCLDGFKQNQGSLVYAPDSNDGSIKSPLDHFVNVSKIWTAKYENVTADIAIVKLDQAEKTLLSKNPVCFLNSAKASRSRKQLQSNPVATDIFILREVDAEVGNLVASAEINLNIVSRPECAFIFGSENLPEYIFCAKILDDSASTPVSAGMGLYARQKNVISGEMQVYLKGIAIKPDYPVGSTKNVNNYHLFVNTEYFLNWITEVLERHF